MIYPSPLDPRPMTRAQRTLGLTLLGLSIVIYIFGRVVWRCADFEYWHRSLFLVSLAVFALGIFVIVRGTGRFRRHEPGLIDPSHELRVTPPPDPGRPR